LAKNGVTRPVARESPRGIPQNKKDDSLAKLGNVIPPSRLTFWRDLPVADVADWITRNE